MTLSEGWLLCHTLNETIDDHYWWFDLAARLNKKFPELLWFLRAHDDARILQVMERPDS